MIMTEVCTVKKVGKRYAYIELVRSGKCDGCKICSFNKRDKLTVPAVADINVAKGDTVVAEMPTKSVGIGSLLIYILPLALMIIGALIGLTGGVWLQVGLSGGGLCLGLVGAIPLDMLYRRRAGVLPRIIQVIAPETERAEGADEQIKYAVETTEKADDINQKDNADG